jgi:2-C-methyl-D-erythritol 4-phosphate cytidylyltransferase
LDRNKLWSTQTPQTFRRELLEKGLEEANKRKLQPDDDAEAVALIHPDIHLVPSSPNNMKVRSADDLVLAAALLRVR